MFSGIELNYKIKTPKSHISKLASNYYYFFLSKN